MLNPGVVLLVLSLILHIFMSLITISSTCPVVSKTAHLRIDLQVENMSILVPTEKRLGWSQCTFVM